MQIGKKIVSVITTLTFMITPVVFFQNNAEASETDEAFWRKMSSDYYYDQLDDNVRKLYDRFDKACMDILLSDEDLTISRIEVNCEDLLIKDDNGGNRSIAVRIAEIFSLSNPQYFFVDTSSVGTIYYSGDDDTKYFESINVGFIKRYKTGSVRAETRAEIEKGMKEIIDTVSKGKRPEDKEHILYERIFKENRIKDPEIKEDNLYNAILGSTYKFGIAALFTAVMNSVGIECVGIDAYDTWNLIRLHGFYYTVNAGVLPYFTECEHYYYNSYNTFDKWIQVYLPELKNDSLENKTEYSSRYITSGDFTYLIVNETTQRRTVVPVYGPSSDVPSSISFNGKEYTVIETAPGLLEGWVNENGSRCFYDASGIILTGLQKIDGQLYCFDPVNGAMMTGWQQIEGKWYFFDNNGAGITGWKNIDGIWYLLDKDGVMATGWKQDSGNWYYFDNSGHMTKGWQKVGGTWYYMSDSGAMVTGWRQISGVWYYFKPSGAMAANEYCGGYWLDASGAWTYKYKASWKQDSKGWWYGDDSGWYAKNRTLKIDGKNYNFDASGYCTNPNGD